MNRMRLFLFICFCLYVEINNRIIDYKYSYDHKYCVKSENPSFFESLNNLIDTFANIGFNLGNIMDNFNGNNDQYQSYSDYAKAQRRKENEFSQNFPTAYLSSIAQRLNVNCILFDTRIDMIDDGSIIYNPYNIRPLK